MRRTLCLAAYDVRDPKRLQMMLHTVKDFACGGQKSAFECWLSTSEKSELLQRAHSVMADEDAFLLLLQAAQIRHDLAAMLYQQARQIGEIAARAVHQPSVEAVRGSEGAATALYFQAYQRLFAPSLGFNNRNRRPPQDPVNVLLSLSYTMLHSTVAKAVQTVGLDPQLGALHEVAYGRDSLVCDLVELQRAQVEWWVWRLCATETIRVEDFTLSDAVGHMPCSFGKAGRGRFYQAFALVQDPWLRDAKQAAWVLVKRLSPQTAILTPVSDEE